MASSTNAGKTLKRANPSTIQDKFLVGYQGWFTCPGDGPPLDPNHHGWLHWFNCPIPDGGRPNTDIWPDVSEYSPSELFAAPGLKYVDGEQAFVFSSRNARTVERHFHWMALHGVDGAFLQRFLGQCDLEQGNEAIRSQRDEVGELVRRAAEKEGRVYAIMCVLTHTPNCDFHAAYMQVRYFWSCSRSDTTCHRKRLDTPAPRPACAGQSELLERERQGCSHTVGLWHVRPKPRPRHRSCCDGLHTKQHPRRSIHHGRRSSTLAYVYK